MRNTNHFSEQDVCYYAILHDVDESETGDIPTPTKRAMRENGVEPNSLFKTQGLLPEPPPHIKDIVKMADLLENWFFIHEHGSGARARRSEVGVKQKLLAAIEDAAPDLQAATREVMDYLINRRSDDPEERERIARHDQSIREMEHFSRNPGSPYVG
jgi:5'-deoxynucleotidase YfbR-like HD superfamily hydrolase